MKIVIYGLTITSSWGNGHATTYRSLAKALARKGHKIHFVEKDVEWYHNNRDLPQPEFCTVRLYEQWAREARELVALAADADVVLIGSYFPDAIAATRAMVNADYGPILFYDIDTPITMAQLREQGKTPISSLHSSRFTTHISASPAGPRWLNSRRTLALPGQCPSTVRSMPTCTARFRFVRSFSAT